METQTIKTAGSIKGGEFLVKETQPQEVFIPEQFDEEQRMIVDMCEDFLKKEVFPHLDRIDKHEKGLMESLMNKAGELGLLGFSLPEKYGGFGKDFNSSTLMCEVIGSGYSFTVSMMAHTGIGTLPILYFGTDEQKKKYLPKLATGELVACYALTEPGSGSDALAAKTKAVLSKDKKHYILNGQKIWITNSGFADVFIVFAQVDGDKFTGFIVEKDFGGITLGDEEHKLGIKGSSTRQVFFENCKVPAENLLGEIGKGHLIAFNILNIGRFKLGAATTGGAKKICSFSVSYANEREQFGQPIANFGAIQHKLAEQAIRIYACESALYRASNSIDSAEKSSIEQGKSHEEALLGAAKEYAVECAILKVAGSEMIDYVVDEGVQIYGGYGYSAEYPMERAYRDARINRIFEGTNEINRMLIMDMLLKRAMKGEIDLLGPAKAIQNELMSVPEFGDGDTSLFGDEKKAVENMKKASLMIAGFAAQKYMQKLANEQEILMNCADMVINTYLSESTLLRTQKLIDLQGEDTCQTQIEITKTYINDAMDRLYLAAKSAIYAMCEGDELKLLSLGLKRFTKKEPFNTIKSRRSIAGKLIKANKYDL
ncbi:MAG: acyl-CoA dehydrogenase [Cytophagales bacterium]|nr:acyl-CoA dehydrogenase [Cytophagales bacterium]